MKFSVQRESFLSPLQFAAGVVEKRHTMAILANVLLEAQDDVITITGSDLEVELIGRCNSGFQVEIPGKITVPARKLYDLIKCLPESSTVNIELDNNRLQIRSGKSKFTLLTIAADDYPKLQYQDDTNSFSVPEKDIKLLCKRTHFAMAQEDVRYYLNGMLLEITKDHIRAVATDGHRLAINTIANPYNDLNITALIPRKAVIELMRLLEDSDGELNMSISPNHIRAHNEQFIFSSKLIESNYPSYDRVIPKNGDKIIVLARDLLKQTFSRASILSNEKFRGIRVELEDNHLRINADNPDKEEANEEIEITYPHPRLEAGFNVDYIIDVLNTLTDDFVTMVFTNSENGLLIEEVIGNCKSQFVVMPMRL